MSALLERFAALPRAARWGVLAGVLMVAYFAIVEPVLDATATASARADALQAGIDRRLAIAAGQSETSRVFALAAAQYGAPLPPGGPERAAALNARIETVLRDRAVSALTIKARAPAALPRTAMPGVIPEGRQAQRLVLDVEFESAPDVAAAVIADLERIPEVAAISRLSMRKVEREGVKRVQVSVSPETWVIAARGASR